jgi:hypothetical protein
MASFINRPGVVKALKVYSVLANPAKTAQQTERVARTARNIKGVVNAVAKGKSKGIPAGETLGRYAGNVVRNQGGSEAAAQVVSSVTSRLVAKGAEAFNDRRAKTPGPNRLQKISRLGNFLADQAGRPSKPNTLPQTYSQWEKNGPIEMPRKPYSAPNRSYGED